MLSSRTELQRRPQLSCLGAGEYFCQVSKLSDFSSTNMGKSLCQKFFSCKLLAWGKIVYFATIMVTNRDNFPTYSLGYEFLNEAEKEKNNGKWDSALALSWFALSAYEVKNNCCLFERLFKIKKNGTFLFGISFFVLEVFTFFIMQLRKSDDIINGFT